MRRVVRDTFVLLVVAAIPALFAAWFHPGLRHGPTPPLNDHEITVQTALSWGDTVLWVDARSADAFARGHVPGAISFDASDEQSMDQLLDRWTPEHRIVVYCDSRSCDLSRSLAERLRAELGVAGVFYLHGGWEAWEQHSP
jgi:rhodanese-related sulfurtransferase